MPGSKGRKKLLPERGDIGETTSIECRVDAQSQRVDTISSCRDIEQGDGVTAGLVGIKLVVEGLPCPPVGVGGEQGVAVYQVPQCPGLAPQVGDCPSSEHLAHLAA